MPNTQYPGPVPEANLQPPRPASELERVLDRLSDLRSYAARVHNNVVGINERLSGSMPAQESCHDKTGQPPGLLGDLQATIDRLEETVADLDHEVTELGTKV